MRRRKLTQTTQINVRLPTALVAQLEALAKENHTTFTEQIRTRLVDSLVPKRDPALANEHRDWLRLVRDTIEGWARGDNEEAKKIEDHWRFLQRLDAKFTVFYGQVETELDPYVKIPKIRELLTGAPTLLPDETKARGQS
jgi:hypothetical protein